MATKPKRKRRRQPPRKIPLILQTRTLTTEDGKEEVTVGDLIVKACRLGAFRSEAAAAASVSRTTIHNWEQRGEDAIAAAQEHLEAGEQVTEADVPEADRPFVAFVNALNEAEASNEVSLVGVIRSHTGKDWRAAAWLLARKHPERWGVREHPESGAGGDLAELERLVDAAAEDE
jgi:hypothetical protein